MGLNENPRLSEMFSAYVSTYGNDIAPYKQIGICGDSDDTGGFYLIIFHDKEQLLYWDITEAGILQQIINDDFEIEWFA